MLPSLGEYKGLYCKVMVYLSKFVYPLHPFDRVCISSITVQFLKYMAFTIKTNFENYIEAFMSEMRKRFKPTTTHEH